MKPIIIAELCSNPVSYGWNFEPFCQQAAKAGATHVKVQLWQADIIYPEHMRAEKKAWEFPREKLRGFAAAARAYGLVPGASVFDRDAAFVAANHTNFLKLAASRAKDENVIHSALEFARRAGRPVYRTVPTLEPDGYWPTMQATLFTIPEYPTGMMAAVGAVLRAAWVFRRAGVRNWGWSSHTTGVADVALAVRLGARVIEKHFCLSHEDVEGGHSLTPSEFAAMVDSTK